MCCKKNCISYHETDSELMHNWWCVVCQQPLQKRVRIVNKVGARKKCGLHILIFLEGRKTGAGFSPRGFFVTVLLHRLFPYQFIPCRYRRDIG